MPFLSSVRGSIGPSGLTLPRGLTVAASAGAPLSFISSNSAYNQGFSSGYYGVDTEDSYIIPNNATLNSITFKKQQSGFYHWWFLVVTKSGNTTSDNTYTIKYGALLPVAAGGSAGDVVTVNLSDALTTFGSATIPQTGTHYIGWHSGSAGYPGATNPSGSLWWADAYPSMGAYSGRSGISWEYGANTLPSLNGTFVAGRTTESITSFTYTSYGVAIKANYTMRISTALVLDGSSPIKAATSARAIKELTGTTTNGYYWIKPTGYDVPRYVYCDMNTNGGGWMLIGWHGGAAGGANSHVSNNEWNSSFTLGSGAYSGAGLTVDAPNNSDSYGVGYRFIKSLVTENRSSAVFSGRWSVGGSTNESSGQNQPQWYYYSDSNADWDKYNTRAAQNGEFSNSDSRYAWLRSGWNTYQTSGRNGGGSSNGGTNTTYASGDWGVVPFNMDTASNDGNHGIAITGFYNNRTASNPNYVNEYYGGHMASTNGSWGRAVALWLKV